MYYYIVTKAVIFHSNYLVIVEKQKVYLKIYAMLLDIANSANVSISYLSWELIVSGGLKRKTRQKFLDSISSWQCDLSSDFRVVTPLYVIILIILINCDCHTQMVIKTHCYGY